MTNLAIAKDVESAAMLAVLEFCGVSTDDAVRLNSLVCFRSDPRASDSVFAMTESPIERKFLLGFWAAGGSPQLINERCRVQGKERDVTSVVITGQANGKPFTVLITPQFEVECLGRTYRLDFLARWIVDDNQRFMAIELDGHDFHERTKEQVRSDNQRDRGLLKIGIPTVRFSGSEINASAITCCWDAIHCAIDSPVGVQADFFSLVAVVEQATGQCGELQLPELTGGIQCSFCGKNQKEVKKLIAGNGSYICDECTRVAILIVEDD